MKLSKREKVLMCMLGMLFIGYMYYQFVYSVQINKITEKKSKKEQVESAYNNAITTINAMEERKSEKKILNTEVSNKTKLFYPTIDQEHLILELNKLLGNSNLKGQYKFEQIEVKDVDSMEKKEKILPKSSLSSFAKNYSNLEEGIIDGNSENKEYDNNNSNADTISNSDSAPIDDTPTSENKKSTNSNNKNTVEQMKCELTFSGTYSQLNEFFNLLSGYERKIIVTNVDINQKTTDTVNGTMKLEFYALPKLDDQLTQYMEWKMQSSYGKESPFASGSTAFVKESSINSDFNIAVNSHDSVLPTVVIGKNSDSLKNTYVYANKNGYEDAEIVLTQDGDNYYYKYKTSKGSYPQDYSGKGKKFVPISDNLIVEILSDIRTDSDDESGIRLKVVNNTDKLAEIDIKGDDHSNPRVTIQGEGSKVSVNNK